MKLAALFKIALWGLGGAIYVFGALFFLAISFAAAGEPMSAFLIVFWPLIPLKWLKDWLVRR